jgi:uracil-DNA glycosylase
LLQPAQNRALEALIRDIRACRLCRDNPKGKALPHEPRPVLQVSSTARIAICGQAPGTRVHASGAPFTDASGDRLRQWLGTTSDEFYDASRIAIIPMGFCFPGLGSNKADLPPRRECAPHWHHRLFDALPNLDLILMVGHYAQRWHLGASCPPTLTATVERWREITTASDRPMLVPLPHPSWRNSGWLKRHPWFETDVLPFVRGQMNVRLRRQKNEV